MRVRQEYIEKLKNLHHYILRMGCLMEEAVKKSIKALEEQDEDLAKQVIAGDDKIDDYEHMIEDFSVRMIATEQPVASDLRTIHTALKIATDLERMADHAVDIAKVAIALKDEVYIKPLIDIPRMAQLAIEMVKDSLDAYVKQDADAAHEISKRDDVIDGLHKQIFMELTSYMIANNKTINQSAHFLFVSRFLERIGDHATNICEWIVYEVTGKREELND